MVRFILGLICCLAYAYCYSKGGRNKKHWGIRARTWRRFIAPMLYSALLIILSLISDNFSWWMLLSPVTYVGAMFLTKYGGDDLWEKIIGRLWSGLIVGLASLPFALPARSWKLFILQVILAVLAHLGLGIKNPFPEKYKAQLEEFSISFLTVVIVPYMGI